VADTDRTGPRALRALPGAGRLRGLEVPTRDFAGTRAELRRKLVRWGLLVLGPLLLAVVAINLYLAGGRVVSIDNAYVKADMVNVANDVSGMVAAVLVHNNQPVSAGQELFRLDDEPFRIALTNAQAQLDQVRNDIEAMKANYRQKQEDIKSAQVNIAYYEREEQRQSDLVGKNFVSRAQYDTARRNYDVARQQLAADKQQLAAIAANLSGNPDIAPAQHPRYLQAEARRDQVARDLRRAVVRASLNGIVTNVDKLQPGQYLAAGTAAFSLVATDHVWVEANPKETELTYVKPGDLVSITVDTYPDVEWRGTVASLSPASGSEFSLLPPQNTSGNWVKVVQRIPIRLRIDTAADMPILRAGMSVVAHIDTGHKRTLASLIKALL
jgi:membrane fusion protein (multidrug efflux system)